MILIGSAAIRHHFPSFQREPKDIDYILRKGEVPSDSQGGVRIEYHRNEVIDECFPKDGEQVLPANMLYTLKVSHASGWDINWEKHMWDIQWMKARGCVLYTELFYRLREQWNVVCGANRRSDLGMSAEAFFTNAMANSRLHDTLHTILNPSPVYLSVLKDGHEVDVSEEKFNKLSFNDKCALVREEVEIMAYERYRHMDFRAAYSQMLKKFIISHCPVWEAVFIIENHVLLHKPTRDYFQILDSGIKTLNYESKRADKNP
jgi:hypothetical protein